MTINQAADVSFLMGVFLPILITFPNHFGRRFRIKFLYLCTPFFLVDFVTFLCLSILHL